MKKTLARIPIGELVKNPRRVLARVVRERKTLGVEKRGEVLILLTPARTTPTYRRKHTRTRADREAFLAAAGSWKSENTDAFVAGIYASRKRSSRPPVNL